MFGRSTKAKCCRIGNKKKYFLFLCASDLLASPQAIGVGLYMRAPPYAAVLFALCFVTIKWYVSAVAGKNANRDIIESYFIHSCLTFIQYLHFPLLLPLLARFVCPPRERYEVNTVGTNRTQCLLKCMLRRWKPSQDQHCPQLGVLLIEFDNALMEQRAVIVK